MFVFWFLSKTKFHSYLTVTELFFRLSFFSNAVIQSRVYLQGYCYMLWKSKRLITHWISGAKNLLKFPAKFILPGSERKNSLIPSLNIKKWLEVRCWLIAKIGVLLVEKYWGEDSTKEVSNWGRDRTEFCLVEISMWIVTIEWILRTCTGYLYPSGHISLEFGLIAKRIIWRRQSRRMRSVLEMRVLQLRQVLRLFTNTFVEVMSSVS